MVIGYNWWAMPTLRILRDRTLGDRHEFAASSKDPDRAIEFPARRLADKRINRSQAVHRAEPDILAMSPDLEVLVDSARKVFDALLREQVLSL